MTSNGPDNEVSSLLEAYDDPKSRGRLLELASRLTGTGYWIFDGSRELIEWSPELYRITGVHPETFELTKRSAVRVYHPEDRSLVIESTTNAWDGGNEFRYEARVVRPDGSIRHIACEGTVGRDSDGEPHTLFGAMHDVTEQKSIYGRLNRTQHLASVGSVATGIAHGVNNPLTSLFVNLELAIEELADPEANEVDVEFLRRTMELAKEGAEKVRRVIGGLKAFAREEKSNPEPVDLRNVVAVAVGLTRNELRHRAQLSEHYAPTPSIMAVTSRLEQVVVGLLLHSVRELEALDFETASIEVSIRPDEKGELALLELRHNGASDLKRVHDELDLMAPPDEFAGLGLAICRAIVREDGGEFSIEQEGAWTVFRLRFPSVALAEDDSEVEVESALRARVLVVDDEEIVGNSMSRILPRDEVVVARSGDEALEVVRDLGTDHFDIILCDMMMPGMSGKELFDAIESEAPELAERVVFVTGGVFSADTSSFLSTWEGPWLKKPYDVAEIRSLVARSTRRRDPESDESSTG